MADFQQRYVPDEQSGERTRAARPGAHPSSSDATTVDHVPAPRKHEQTRVSFGPLPPLPAGERCRLVIEHPWGVTFRPVSEAGWAAARSAVIDSTRRTGNADLAAISLQCPSGTIRSLVQCTPDKCGFSLIEPREPRTQVIAGAKKRRRRRRR